jgi:hypothetical protein
VCVCMCDAEVLQKYYSVRTVMLQWSKLFPVNEGDGVCVCVSVHVCVLQ